MSEDNEDRDEVLVDHDTLLGEIGRVKKEEGARKSDAAESGAKTKEFLEETRLNSQAFSWMCSIVKKLDKKDGESKAMDIIRSLEAGLPMIKNHVLGQQDEMDLEPEESAPTGVDDSGEDPETDDFNDAVDEAVGGDNVEPFDPDAA